MKIAAVTLTRNDDFRLVPWKMYFQDYKDELYEHIVVDNGSTPEYQRKLREAFPDSTHIELGYNGGCTGAYNAGIRHALQNPEIDTVMLIGNDIKIERGGVTPVLLKKDSDTVELFGTMINMKTGKSRQLYHNSPLSDVKETSQVVSCVPGGLNMSKSMFYMQGGGRTAR